MVDTGWEEKFTGAATRWFVGGLRAEGEEAVEVEDEDGE